jgi:hypothetical protein
LKTACSFLAATDGRLRLRKLFDSPQFKELRRQIRRK